MVDSAGHAPLGADDIGDMKRSGTVSFRESDQRRDSFVEVYNMFDGRSRSVSLYMLALLTVAGCWPVVQGAEMQESPARVEKPSPSDAFQRAAEDLFRVRLLMSDAVQKDLQLTSEQMGVVNGFIDLSREQFRDLVAIWPDLPATSSDRNSESRFRELSKWSEDSQKTQRESVVRAIKMLTPSQSERLKQIELQQTAAVSLMKPEMIKALGISEAQLSQIRTFLERSDAKLQAEAPMPGGDVPILELRKRMLELGKTRDRVRIEANRLAVEILTQEQRLELKQFTGTELEVVFDHDALLGDEK